MQGYSKFKFNYGKVSINCKRYKKIRGKLTVTICVKYFSEYVLISWHDALCRASREFGSLSLDVNAQCVSQPLLNSSYKVTGVPTPVSAEFWKRRGCRCSREPSSSLAGASSHHVCVCSEEVGLAHDAHELVLADLAVAIPIGLLDHLLDLIVGHVLA